MLVEVDRASGAHRIFASGMRNPTGLQWEPETGKLWASPNERDEIGPDLVPDYLTSVRDGGFYGWPYSYYGQHLDPRIMPQRPDLVASAIAPDYALSSHVAHWDWRCPPVPIFPPTTAAVPSSANTAAGIEHLLTATSCLRAIQRRKSERPGTRCRHRLPRCEQSRTGRPVGLAMDRSGALLIADDVGNTVWRVSSARPDLHQNRAANRPHAARITKSLAQAGLFSCLVGQPGAFKSRLRISSSWQRCA